MKTIKGNGVPYTVSGGGMTHYNTIQTSCCTLLNFNAAFLRRPVVFPSSLVMQRSAGTWQGLFRH